MKIVRAFLVILIGLMLGVIGYALGWGDFQKEGAVLTSMPWGIVSLVDLYTGFILFSCWFFYREESAFVASVWAVLLMTLGFWIACAYVLIQLNRSRGNWTEFWMRSRTNE